MELFRKYLIWIRKQDNRGDLKPQLHITLSIIIILGIGLGVIVDILIPFGFIFNMLRGIITTVTGISTFSLIFVIGNRFHIDKLSKDQYYLTTRKRFSYRQRVNISIVIGGIMTTLIMLTSRQDAIYTLRSSVVVALIFLLVSFCRRDRSEFLKNIYNIPDVKDFGVPKLTRQDKEKNKDK